MPMHDWTRVTANEYHFFHGRWLFAMCDHLNAGLLPKGYSAYGEQVVVPHIPDVLPLRSRQRTPTKGGSRNGTAVLAKPATQTWQRATEETIRPQRRIAIRHNSGKEVVAAIELFSHANKKTQADFEAFVVKCLNYFYTGIHLLLIDPFAPSRRDPDGMHAAIWQRFGQVPRVLPDDTRRAAVSYSAGKKVAVYLEPFGLNDPVPDMPLFLLPTKAVTVPLEASYTEAWNHMPDDLREQFVD